MTYEVSNVVYSNTFRTCTYTHTHILMSDLECNKSSKSMKLVMLEVKNSGEKEAGRRTKRLTGMDGYI